MAYRAPASDDDRADMYALLTEHFAGGGISEVAELRERVGQVATAEFTDEVGAGISGLPALVPSRVGEGLPVAGNRSEVIRLLEGHQALGRISELDLVRRVDSVLVADLASQVAAAVADLPRLPGGVTPVDAVHTSVTNSLGTTTSGRHPVSVYGIFKPGIRTVDDYDAEALERVATAVQAVNAHGLLLDPPARTGDLLTDLVETDSTVNYLVEPDAGRLRTGSQMRRTWNAPEVVHPKRIREKAALIAAEFRADNMLRGLSRADFELKFCYYLWRLDRLSPFTERAYGRTSRVERLVLSLYADAAGWQIDWTKAPRPPRDLFALMAAIQDHSYAEGTPAGWFAHPRNESARQELQTAAGRMASRAGPQGGRGSAEWARAELNRHGFPQADLRFFEAIGYNEATARRDRGAQTGRHRGSPLQQTTARIVAGLRPGSGTRGQAAGRDGGHAAGKRRGGPGRPAHGRAR